MLQKSLSQVLNMVDIGCSISGKEKKPKKQCLHPQASSLMMLQEENELATDRVFGVTVLSTSYYQIVCL